MLAISQPLLMRMLCFGLGNNNCGVHNTPNTNAPTGWRSAIIDASASAKPMRHSHLLVLAACVDWPLMAAKPNARKTMAGVTDANDAKPSTNDRPTSNKAYNTGLGRPLPLHSTVATCVSTNAMSVSNTTCGPDDVANAAAMTIAITSAAKPMSTRPA